MSDLPATMTMVAFAKLHGVCRAAAYKWKARGLIVMTAGKVDVAASNKLLVEQRRDHSRGGAAQTSNAGQPEAGSEVWTTAEAVRRERIAVAKLRELELTREAGKVADVAEVAEKVGKRLGVVRARMLAISSALAARLAALNTAEACAALLDTEIRAALAELSS
jgi:hypothetical protein